MIAVTGATGFVGRTLLAKLLADGRDVRVLVRRPEALERLGVSSDRCLSIVEGDVADAEAVGRLAEGAEAVVHLATAVSSGRASRPEVFRTNVQGTAELIRACKRASVRRFVYTSTQVVRLRELGDYAQSKRIGEHLVLDSGLPATILRLNIVYGRGSEGLFPRLVAMIRGAPVVPIIGDGTTIVRPVLAEDVAATITACLERDVAVGKIYDVGGGDAVSFEGLIREIMDTLGVAKRVLHVPGWAARVLARIGELLPRAPITQDTVSYFAPWPPCGLGALRRDLSLSPTGLQDGLRAVLAEPRGTV